MSKTYFPFVHFTLNTIVDLIRHSNELWGTDAAIGFGIGGCAARAWMGPLDRSRLRFNGGVEFGTDVMPDYPVGGPRIVLWRKGSPGTVFDGTYVRVPIEVTDYEYSP